MTTPTKYTKVFVFFYFPLAIISSAFLLSEIQMGFLDS